MHAVSVSGLKHNPADALRQARSSPVVVLNRDHPDAVLIGLAQGGRAAGTRGAGSTGYSLVPRWRALAGTGSPCG